MQAAHVSHGYGSVGGAVQLPRSDESRVPEYPIGRMGSVTVTVTLCQTIMTPTKRHTSRRYEGNVGISAHIAMNCFRISLILFTLAISCHSNLVAVVALNCSKR